MALAVRCAFVILAAAAGSWATPAALVSAAAAQEAPTDCRQWQDCQQQALAAEERGDYPRFHDLAWRAVQTGQRNDRTLMFLLARAQARSGRPHDALVMLQRLAEAGVKVDASDEAFARTRELPGWPAIEAVLAGGSAPAAAIGSPSSPPPSADGRRAPAAAGHAPANAAALAKPTASATSSAAVSSTPSARAGARLDPPPPTAPVPAAPSASTVASPGSSAPPAASAGIAAARPPLTRTDAARFTASRFAGGGFAYDAVSQRFVIGDALAKKLVVVGVGGAEPTDMVRADSAGFEDVTAVEIDERRGDLWVAGAGGAIHRLQLVSGRPLKTYKPAENIGVVGLVDLAVSPASGTVFGLDATGRRLLSLARGAERWEVSSSIDVTTPVSIALQDDASAFVAHANGLSRVDLRAHTTNAVAVPEGLDVRGIERLRLFHGSLLAVQRKSDGAGWRLLRITLSGSRRITGATVLDDVEGLKAAGGSGDKAPFIAAVGDELYYVASSDTSAGGTGAYVVRRLSPR